MALDHARDRGRQRAVDQSQELALISFAGEIFFHRGAGITIGKNGWQATVFGSYRHLDANFISDTSQSFDDYVSSLQTSGYHRTKSEVEDKGVQRQLAFGGNVSYNFKRWHTGINAIQYKFKYQFQCSGMLHSYFSAHPIIIKIT